MIGGVAVTDMKVKLLQLKHLSIHTSYGAVKSSELLVTMKDQEDLK